MAQLEHTLPVELFLDLERSGPVPIYYQLSSRLERAIDEGLLPPGSRLENEVSLGTRLGLSRPTVRRAIQELVDKGLLVRRRGIGTVVVHGRITRNVELTSLFDDLVRSGEKPRTTVLSLEVKPADEASAEHLNIEIGSPTLSIERVRFTGDTPLAVLHNVLPEQFIDITIDDLELHGLYQMLRARGTTIQVAKQTIGARTATTRESGLLDVHKNFAVLTMTRTAFDNSGRAIEFGQHCYRPDLYSFEVTLVDR